MSNPCFISVLGTNDYLPCNYYHSHDPEHRVEGVRFVQEAIARLMDETTRNRLTTTIFVTKEAYTKNWLDNGHNNRQTGETLAREGLATCLRRLGLQPEAKNIPVGESEKEIWEIFQTITTSIPENASLIVDITHSFRSLSMVLLAAIQYLKTVKDVNVTAIHYGALEALGQLHDVRKLDIAQRNVPIFDLTPFDAILDWSHAVRNFRESGNAAPLVRLAQRPVGAKLAETRGESMEARSLRDFINSLRDWNQCLTVNRAPEVREASATVSTALERVKEQAIAKESVLLPPLMPLLEQIQTEVAAFQGDHLDIALQTARWCLAHSFIPQGYTALQEGLVSWCMQQAGEEDIMDKDARTAASAAFNIFNQKIIREKWNKDARKHEKLVTTLHYLAGFKELAKLFNRLSTYRNNINHGGYNSDPLTADKLHQNLNQLINDISKWKTMYAADISREKQLP